MSDLKSKLPNLQEVASYAGKLFKDVKNSVCEIVDQYKKNREEEEQQAAKEDKKESDIVASAPHAEAAHPKEKTVKPKRKTEAKDDSHKE